MRNAFCWSTLVLLAVGCASSAEDTDARSDDFSSNQATLLEFEFDGVVETDDAFFDADSLINDQMLYTIGHLNGSDAVGRLDLLSLSAITQESNGTPNGKRVKYHAKLPVSWGAKTALPSSYAFTLPRLASFQGQEAFTAKYKGKCVDFGAHDVDSGSMWYYYRPSSCTLDAKDVVKFTATAKRSEINTVGKYPEYDKVWEDGVLNVVSIFGKYEDGATSGDAGITAFNSFVASMKTVLGDKQLVTKPATVPANPGVALPDITFSATLPDGKKVVVTALLVDNISQATPAFYDRYNTLSTEADLIAYNGHAGLGQNVRALASKGKWRKGKYVIVFMNGCDTFAYVDGSLAQTRAAINTDDPKGTKYMEFVTNTLPAFFASMANGSVTLMKGLLRYDAPMTYDQIFEGIDDSQIVVVTGEEDNTFTPGTGPTTWQGIQAKFSLAKNAERRFETGVLGAGKYEFALTGTGDGDLYVKAGDRVTRTKYDCRPLKSGSAETCQVTLTKSNKVSVLVRGYAANSNLNFVARKL